MAVDRLGRVVARRKRSNYLGKRSSRFLFPDLGPFSGNGPARRITNDLSDYKAASLSADSKRILTVQTQSLSNIWTQARREGGQAKSVTSGAGRYFDLTWTPDSRILYASDASGSAEIYEMESDGSGQRQLTAGGRQNNAPAVSPDGR